MNTFIGGISDLPFFDIMLFGFSVVLSMLFVMYSLVIVGQTSALRKVVVTDHSAIIQYISIAQLIIAIAVLIASLVY